MLPGKVLVKLAGGISYKPAQEDDVGWVHNDHPQPLVPGTGLGRKPNRGAWMGS